MPLQIYDTGERQKRPFEPIDPDHVRLYVCGPTVYDRAHVGNARPVVVFDTLVRYLRVLYPKVTYVRNITDVEDKIVRRAQEENRSIADLTTETTALFHADMAALGTLPPDVEPRATAHITDMLKLIEALVARGHAYVADGHVLFETATMPDYGAFSRKSRDELIAGARVEVASYKKSPMDFVLWKPSDAETPGWDSPWGKGRPGWHIECSAMAKRYLGETFDIHGGGIDLIFPHHQNEIAQSHCAHDGQVLAKYWMHNGFVMVEGEKMSKSLGNFFTVHDMLTAFPGRGEAIRLTLLATQYRQPLDFTKDGIRQSIQVLDRWYRALRQAGISEEVENGLTPKAADIPEALQNALDDDLNTPQVIAILHGYADQVFAGDKAAAQQLRAGAGLLGLLWQAPEAWFQSGMDEGLSAPVIEAEIARRKAARAAKDFATADKIRDDLAAAGIVLEDRAGETLWRRAAE